MNVEDIKKIVAYDPSLPGCLRRLVSRGNTKAGSSAGRPDSRGYWRTHLHGKDVKNHRIVWLLCTGEWPTQPLDHINRVKSDNRIENLRLASNAENCGNQGVRKNNKCGLQGVHLHKKTMKYRASITKNGLKIDLGLHSTAEEAHCAYLLAKSKLHTIGA